MSQVVIYQPAKTAMQSGKSNTRQWVMQYKPTASSYIDPFMGWIGSRSTNSQVILHFDTCEEAIVFATKHHLKYQVHRPHVRALKAKSYAGNFR